jgi:hypothetical protein
LVFASRTRPRQRYVAAMSSRCSSPRLALFRLDARSLGLARTIPPKLPGCR